ncbi:MAG: aspartate/glutamate racemase family protein [Intestinibacter sp.]|uniref:aspartate/glutamate racemase family protein n=1 Tax=Intestinibacter sp. TaxID=1965304 RepID=UPI003F13D331
MYKTIGIIGGMGPKATCDLMEKIIASTDAENDQGHIHICVDCNTNIPDRTKAIVDHGKNPIPEMVKSGIRLESMGANLLIMPCNTAHYFYDELIKYLDVPFLNMPFETGKYLKKKGIKKVGILATDGTVQSKIYDKPLMNQGIEVVYPSSENQKSVMSLIYDCVKSHHKDYSEVHIEKVVQELLDKGAEKIILACTELPIAFRDLGIDKNCVDPTLILARSAVEFAGARVVEQ